MNLSEFMRVAREDQRRFEEDWRQRQLAAQKRSNYEATEDEWRQRLIAHLQDELEEDAA